MSKKIGIIALLLALLALGIVLFRPAPLAGGAEAKKETAFERVMRTRTIRCAYASWPPYFMIEPNTKQKSGIFYEIAEAIGKLADLKIEWSEDVSYSLLAQNLNTGKQDVFCSLLWISTSRGQRLEFTSPVAYMPLYAYARDGDTRFDNNLESINDEKITISTADGTTMKGVADSTFPKAKQFSVPEMSDAVQVIANVAAEKGDVVLSGSDTVFDYNRNNSDKKLRRIPSAAPVRLFGESLGVAKGEWELRDMLNVAIAELHGDGTIERILTKYEVEPNSIRRVAKPYATPANQ